MKLTWANGSFFMDSITDGNVQTSFHSESLYNILKLKKCNVTWK